MFSCVACEIGFQREPCWIHAKNVPDRKTTPLAVGSLPDILYLEPSDALAENGMLSDCKSVHSTVFIPAHTIFGPLLAPLFRSKAPSDDDNRDRTDLQRFQLDNDYFCNWMKYVRFASSRDEQNLSVVLRGEDVVFVTTRSISPGEELKIYYTEELDEDAVSLQEDGLAGMIASGDGNCEESSGNRFVIEEILFTSLIPETLPHDSSWPEAVSIRGAREYQILPPDGTMLPAGDLDYDHKGNVDASSRTMRKTRRSGHNFDVAYEESDEVLSDSPSGSARCLRSGTKRKTTDRNQRRMSRKNGTSETVNQTDGEKLRRGRSSKRIIVGKLDDAQKSSERLIENPRGRSKRHQNADINEGSSSSGVRRAKPPKQKRLSKKAIFLARMKAVEASGGSLGRQKQEKLRKYPKKLTGADYDAFLYRIPCPECPLHFYTQTILAIHRYQHGIESNGVADVSDMKCIDCRYTATDLMELSQHMDQHGVSVDATLETVPPEHRSHPHCYLYACERSRCMKWFCTETQLKQHRLSHYPALPVDFDGLLCSQCGYTAVSTGELAEHVTDHGRTVKDVFYCWICRRDVKQSLSDHVKHNHEDYYTKISLDFPHQCSLCSVRFPTHVSRKRHVCKNKRPQCYMCARQFSDFKKLTAHLPSHEINGKYPCPSCDFLSVNSSAILAHIAKVHDTSTNRICPICQKVVKSSYQLNFHIKTHNNTLNYLCDLCGKRFNMSRYLLQHRHYMHGTEKRLKVKRKLEEKRLRGEVPARNTKGLRLEDYPFRCEECRVGFLREGPHARHMHEKHLV